MSIKQKSKSLKARASELSDTFVQLQVLNGKDLVDNQFPKFTDKAAQAGHQQLKPSGIEIFQINIGKLCNQTCAHCHVDAGPDRREENMDRATLEKCLEIIAATPSIHSVDITGGAPEMNPHFRWFVEACRHLGKKIMVRCNLTIIVANPKYYSLPNFFARHKVQVVSSLPYFSKRRTDSQRGDGVFEDSIKALKMLNAVGYGKEETGLELNLVFNPSGAFLPGDQMTLEAEFKRQLQRKYNIVFNNLFAITNLPIARFLDYLIQSGNYASYMQALIEAYNPGTLEGLMCRNTLSISWDGYIYDCDFNQMLDLKVASKVQHINDFDAKQLQERSIVLNQHCYGCTAGAGSSCGGEVV
ncbi:MAG: arsenosugar biosynthesis radical SAM (seleno)protein ArsS [Bacteroidota bacterium]